MPQLKTLRIYSVALILLCLDRPCFGTDLPPNIDQILHNNVDKIDFDSFTVLRTTHNQEGQWLCGTMNVRLAMTGTYATVKICSSVIP